MSFPSGTSIPVTNLNSGTADPSQARADIYAAVVALNNIIASADTASGVALLSTANKYDGTKFPTTITVTGIQYLAPTAGIVNIQDVLRLTAMRATDLSSMGGQLGDIAVSQDADGGNAAFCMWDGTHWRYVGLSSWGTI